MKKIQHLLLLATVQSLCSGDSESRLTFTSAIPEVSGSDLAAHESRYKVAAKPEPYKPPKPAPPLDEFFHVVTGPTTTPATTPKPFKTGKVPAITLAPQRFKKQKKKKVVKRRRRLKKKNHNDAKEETAYYDARKVVDHAKAPLTTTTTTKKAAQTSTPRTLLPIFISTPKTLLPIVTSSKKIGTPTKGPPPSGKRFPSSTKGLPSPRPPPPPPPPPPRPLIIPNRLQRPPKPLPVVATTRRPPTRLPKPTTTTTTKNLPPSRNVLPIFADDIAAEDEFASSFKSVRAVPYFPSPAPLHESLNQPQYVKPPSKPRPPQPRPPPPPPLQPRPPQLQPQPQPQPQPSTSLPHPVLYPRNGDNEEYHYEKRPYSFTYGVKDDDSGQDFYRAEESSGPVTKGSYKVALPDGRTQIVEYVADENGYHASVTYEGDPIYPSPSEYQRGPPANSLDGYKPYNPPTQVYPQRPPPPPPTARFQLAGVFDRVLGDVEQRVVAAGAAPALPIIAPTTYRPTEKYFTTPPSPPNYFPAASATTSVPPSPSYYPPTTSPSVPTTFGPSYSPSYRPSPTYKPSPEYSHSPTTAGAHFTTSLPYSHHSPAAPYKRSPTLPPASYEITTSSYGTPRKATSKPEYEKPKKESKKKKEKALDDLPKYPHFPPASNDNRPYGTKSLPPKTHTRLTTATATTKHTTEAPDATTTSTIRSLQPTRSYYGPYNPVAYGQRKKRKSSSDTNHFL